MVSCDIVPGTHDSSFGIFHSSSSMICNPKGEFPCGGISNSYLTISSGEKGLVICFKSSAVGGSKSARY